MGMVGRREWLTACAGSVAVLDRYVRHHEREMALSFRQMDALAAGAPLISDPDTPLAQDLRQAGAGWVDEPLDIAIHAALKGGKGVRGGVRRLAAEFTGEHASRELLAWVPGARERGPSVLNAARGLAAARAQAEVDRAARRGAEAEVSAKRAEVDALHQQIRALTSAVEATSAAVADVAAFRRETVAVLGARLSGVEATREQLLREVETLHADLQKKNAELAALASERDRLLNVFRWRR